jgi:hypothetical protein
MNFLQKTLSGLLGLNSNQLFSRMYMVGTAGEVYLDVNKPFEIYNTIPEAQIVINKFADMYSNFRIVIKDKNGKEIENVPEFDLLNQPNFLKSQNDYFHEEAVHFLVYGNLFTKKNQPSKLTAPISLFNISPQYINPKLTGKLFDQIELKGAISEYIYNDGRERKGISVEDVMYVVNASLDNPLIGQSKLVPLKYPLSNIDGAYRYRNAILTKKGALGFVFSKTTAETALGNMSVGFSEKDKETIESSYFDTMGTGDNQKPFKLVDREVGFTPTSYPTKDMLLFEEVEVNKLTIADAYGLSTNIFRTNTTFENLKSGIVQSYQDAIIPHADMMAQRMTKFLELDKRGLKLEYSYDHIDILKESKLNGANAIATSIQAINNAVQNNLIDRNRATLLIDTLLNSLT